MHNDISLLEVDEINLKNPIIETSFEIKEKDPIYVLGYPGWLGEDKHKEIEKRTHLTYDEVSNLFFGFEVKIFSRSIYLNSHTPLSKYQLLPYLSHTLGGMSGGPVFNKDSKLVGIHVGGGAGSYNLFLPTYHPAFKLIINKINN